MNPSVQTVAKRARASRSRPSKGAALPVALVCLLVIMSLLGTMLQGALRARRQLHAERDLRQAQWLLEAAADRAAFHLRRDAQYKGETWDVPAAELLGRGDGQAVIEVAQDATAMRREVHVIAEYPRGSDLSVRRSRTFIVETQPTQNKE